METNPLAAVVMFATADHVHDLDKEITATENYLAGLKAMRQVAGSALNVPVPTGPVVEEEPEKEAPPPAVTVLSVGKEPAKSGESTKAGRPKVKTGNAAGRPMSGATALIAEVLHKNIDMPTDEVFRQVREQNKEITDSSLKSLIYTVRSRIKDKRAKGEPVAYDTTKLAPKQPPKTAAPAEKKPEHLGGLVDDVRLRKKVAEYLFKRGLGSGTDLVRDCGLDGMTVQKFMGHPWFEFVNSMNKWKLSTLGKQEGVEW